MLPKVNIAKKNYSQRKYRLYKTRSFSADQKATQETLSKVVSELFSRFRLQKYQKGILKRSRGWQQLGKRKHVGQSGHLSKTLQYLLSYPGSLNLTPGPHPRPPQPECQFLGARRRRPGGLESVPKLSGLLCTGLFFCSPRSPFPPGSFQHFAQFSSHSPLRFGRDHHRTPGPASTPGRRSPPLVVTTRQPGPQNRTSASLSRPSRQGRRKKSGFLRA